MQIKTDGLVIRDTNVGEDDRIVTVLTREKGIVRASARGARRVKSRFAAAARLFCYSDFTLYKGRDKYIINEAEPIEFFIGVNRELEKLSLAQYFAELCAFLAPEEENAQMYLRLMLNALHLTDSGRRPLPQIKSVLELRMLTLSGYMPDIIACRECGYYEADKMSLDPVSGTLICSDCAAGEAFSPVSDRHARKIELSKGALAAMRHIVYADFEKLFSFELPQDGLKQLARATENYCLCRLERSFKTLDFYNSLL